jgi:hypothetical protein
MFSIHCPNHQTEILLGPRAIEAMVDTAEGIALHWRCHCGARGTLLTGRRATERSTAEVALAA